MAGTNPFDFDDDLPPPPPPRPVGGRGVGGVGARRSTNPFGDDDDVGVGGGGRPPPSPSRRPGASSSPTTTSSPIRARASLVSPPPPPHPRAPSDPSSVGGGEGFGAVGGGSPHDGGGDDDDAWHDLGDLPYRRVRLHRDVAWGRKPGTSEGGGGDHASGSDAPSSRIGRGGGGEEEEEERFGLSFYPRRYADAVRSHRASALVSPGGGTSTSSVARLLATTTTTLVAGCPDGGPLAAVTVPLATTGGTASPGGGPSATTGFGPRATIRIMTNSGALISSVPFPPRDLVGRRSPGDVLTIGFTSRCVLTVVLRDSLVLCYDLAGDPALPPFYALPGPRGGSRGVGGQGGSVGGSAGGGTDLLEARTYGGGVAVLGADHNAAIVELLDEFDGPAYPEGADASARRIAASSAATQPSSSSSGDPARSPRVSSAGGGPSRYALITPLPTGAFARARHLTYRCLAVLPREHAPSRRPELFLSTSDGSVVVAEAHPSTSPDAGATDVDCRGRMGGSGSVEGMGRPRPVASMSFAPNGRFLACWTSDGWLTVVSSDFTNKVLEFDARGGCPGPPRSMGWCGEDSVALHWKEAGVLLVGPYGHQLPFSYRERGASGGGYGGDRGGDGGRGAEVYLVPEIDCCRVATSHSVEILQRVPPVAADLLRIGSIEPGALLLDASDAFDAGSPNADEAARAITRQEGLLEEAIAQCVEAAAGEFDVRAQKRMLRAASYGLHFACRDEVARRDGGGGGGGGGDGRGVVAPGRPSPEAAAFVATARKLRVLNALRSPGIGFATTSSQYDSMGPRGVAARLIAAGRPSLAASVAGYLKLGRRVVDRARATKAAAFVSSRSAKAAGMTDAQMAQEAMRLLRGEEEGGGSSSTQTPPSAGAYASVALAAHRAGRKGVADVLVRQEESPDDRVRALLDVGSYAEAAAAACRARDPDLVQEALSAYEGSFSDNEEGKNLYFAGVANKFPAEAVNMLTAYHSRMGTIEGGDARPAMNVLLRRQKHLEAGLWRAKRAVARPSMTTSSTGEGDGEKEKVEALKEASKIFDLGGKDCAFQKSCTDEQVALLAEQEQLRRTYGAREVAPPSSSVTATIASVLKYGAVDPRAAFRLGADADRIAKKYKVPEKRMWHVKVRALAESGQWPLLRNFADTRARPPIGIKPFALAAIRGGRGHVEVEHYAKRMTDKSDGEDRYEVFCEAGMWKRALEEAANLGDGRKIAHVRSMCNSPDVQRLCDRYI